MPVIQASRAASAMGQAALHRKRDALGDLLHAGAELAVREIDDAERDLGVADSLPSAGSSASVTAKPEPSWTSLGGHCERLAGRHEGAQLDLLERGEERHAFEAVCAR